MLFESNLPPSRGYEMVLHGNFASFREYRRRGYCNALLIIFIEEAQYKK